MLRRRAARRSSFTVFPEWIDGKGQTSTLSLTAIDETGKAGAGSVSVSASAGPLKTPQVVTLGPTGTATLKFQCDQGTDSDCTGAVELEGSWPRPRGSPVTASKTIQVGTASSIYGTLKQYVGPTIWMTLLRVAAVDSLDRLYVTDGANVYVVANGVPSLYLASSDLPDDAGIQPGQHGRIVDSQRWPRRPALPAARRRAAHLHRAVGGAAPGAAALPAQPHRLLLQHVCRGADRFYVASGNDGLLEVTDAGSRILYGNIGVSDCVAPDLTALPDFFFYTSGCGSPPVVGGRLDGSGSAVLHTTTAQVGFGRASVPDSVVAFDQARPSLFYLATDGGITDIRTTPTLSAFAATQAAFFLTTDFDLIQGPTGTIYLVAGAGVYEVTRNN